MTRAFRTWIVLCGWWTVFSLVVIATILFVMWRFVAEDLAGNAWDLGLIVAGFVWLPGIGVFAVVSVVEAWLWFRPGMDPRPARRDWRSAERPRGEGGRRR